MLRARTADGIDQEVYALLVTYQLLRTAMADATGIQPDIDPDRASFTTALHTARDQVIQAAGIIAEATIDLAGTIGRHVLAHLMPTGANASVPASSNAPSRNTRPEDRTSTAPATRPPSASTSPPANRFDDTPKPLTTRPWD